MRFPNVHKPPFPWFGGKSRVAGLVWQRFGEVRNYVEPFAGSLAVLLNRPGAPGIETVNDLDCLLANFWRALKYDPDGVAECADNPVNEADQHARHLWLCHQEEFRERMKVDPDYYDAKIAGWWVWGQCIWIGSGWCSRQLPHLGTAGTGIHRKLPHLGDAGKGVHRKLPHLGDAGKGGLSIGSDLTSGIDSASVAHAVRDWAVAHGDDPKMRIALCGYQGEHKMPKSWRCIPWKARGGYGSQSDGRGRDNAALERIWFSPHCLSAAALRMRAA